MGSMTLGEFLQTCIGEDHDLWSVAAEAQLALVAGPRQMELVPPENFARRMLAEVEAKRRILAAVDLRPCGGDCRRAMAAVYADREGFREEWRP